DELLVVRGIGVDEDDLVTRLLSGAGLFAVGLRDEFPSGIDAAALVRHRDRHWQRAHIGRVENSRLDFFDLRPLARTLPYRLHTGLTPVGGCDNFFQRG